METRTLKFEIDGFEGGIESTRTGDEVVISYGGLRVLGFDARNLTSRDLTIAALLENGFKGLKVAQLCHTSPAQVSMVRKLVRAGGHEALVHNRPGRPAKLTAAVVKEAKKLRAEGLTHKAIGEQLGISTATARVAVKGVKRGSAAEQQDLELASLEAPVTGEPMETDDKTKDGELNEGIDEEHPGQDGDEGQELVPGEPLPSGPARHQCRYAGALLICAALHSLGVFEAMDKAQIKRPKKSVYRARQAVVALLSAWAIGLSSLEAMHERDARSLGVVLGLERCPSVRTLHRAIAQMVAAFSPVAFGAALIRGLMGAVNKIPRVFGIDGHFKTYFGKEPIDKGWDTKRRMGHRGVADVLVHDEQGRIWEGIQVAAGDGLRQHVLAAAERLRKQMGADQPVVMAFDRGGFSFESINALAEAGFKYVAWVPSTVAFPDLAVIAPATDGVGEQRWDHDKLTADNKARLLVERDGEALLPVVTNLSDDISAEDALLMLRKVRGWQENDIKAARSFAHIDKLVDRGAAERQPDHRLVPNPPYKKLLEEKRKVTQHINELEAQLRFSKRGYARRDGLLFTAQVQLDWIRKKLSETPAKVPANQLVPQAQRAILKTRNRALLQPLKYAVANARRWLLEALGSEALAPSDALWDASTIGRTVEALIKAPGSVAFSDDTVHVVLDLPLPPKPHQRIDTGLASLSRRGLWFSDGARRVTFSLAPRPTRDSLPSAPPVQQGGQ